MRPKAITPRRLPHMVSARFEPELVTALRERATELGITMSQLLREAAWKYLLFCGRPDYNPSRWSGLMTCGRCGKSWPLGSDLPTNTHYCTSQIDGEAGG